jgi:flagellar motor switch protein FliN/FliY
MVDPNESFSPEDFGLDDVDTESEPSNQNLDPAELQQRIAEENSPLNKIDLTRMKLVLDVPLKVSVELGRTKLLVNDLLQLGQGSVIELDKMAGEPMEIYVNDKLVAMGEVVVVNEKFGVRLTDVMSGVGFEDFGPKDVA